MTIRINYESILVDSGTLEYESHQIHFGGNVEFLGMDLVEGNNITNWDEQSSISSYSDDSSLNSKDLTLPISDEIHRSNNIPDIVGTLNGILFLQEDEGRNRDDDMLRRDMPDSVEAHLNHILHRNHYINSADDDWKGDLIDYTRLQSRRPRGSLCLDGAMMEGGDEDSLVLARRRRPFLGHHASFVESTEKFDPDAADGVEEFIIPLR